MVVEHWVEGIKEGGEKKGLEREAGMVVSVGRESGERVQGWVDQAKRLGEVVVDGKIEHV